MRTKQCNPSVAILCSFAYLDWEMKKYCDEAASVARRERMMLGRPSALEAEETVAGGDVRSCQRLSDQETREHLNFGRTSCTPIWQSAEDGYIRSTRQ